MISPPRIPFRFLTIVLAAVICTGASARALPAPFATADDSSGRSELYRQGQKALAEARFGEAAALFDKLAAEGGDETDAALYWKAYAAAKASRKADALESIRRLRSSYPESAWVDDGAALELSLRDGGRVQADAERAMREAERAARAAAGATRNVERTVRDAERAVRDAERLVSRRATALDEQEELKLYALNGLMQADPERAVPVLEKFLQGDQSLLLKERALFVLSQSDSPRARQILLETARTGAPAALRVKAIQMFGIAGEPEDLAALGALYREGTPEVRHSILDAWMIADATAPVLAAAKQERDAALRGRAIELLGVMDAHQALAELWTAERDPALKSKLLDAFAISGNSEMLARAARTEEDPALRVKAIQGLGLIDDDTAGRELLAIYEVSNDPASKRAVLDGLMIRDDDATLIALFRKETDPGLKREIVQKLSLIDSDEATEELMRLLEEKK